MKIILSILFVFVFAFAAFGQSNCPVTLSINSTSVHPYYLAYRIVPIDITAASNCAWSSANSPSWITFSTNAEGFPYTGSISGIGNARIYVVAQENFSDDRTGTFTINNQTFTIMQGNQCAYNQSGGSVIGVPASGGTQAYKNPQNGGNMTYCSITYTTDDLWIHLNPTTFTSDANFGALRTGTIIYHYGTGKSLTYTVSQAAGTPAPTPTPTPTPACTFALGTNGQTFTYTGGSGLIDVITQSGCAYTATNNDSFVTLSNSSGTGNGTINFDVAANSTGTTRTSTITVQGQTFTVTQTGGKTRKRVRFF